MRALNQTPLGEKTLWSQKFTCASPFFLTVAEGWCGDTALKKPVGLIGELRLLPPEGDVGPLSKAMESELKDTKR